MRLVGKSLLILACLCAGPAFAQSIGVDSVVDIINGAMAPAISKIASNAYSWLGAFAVLQFVMTNYGQLKANADLDGALFKMVGAVAWVGVVLYLMQNGPQFIVKVGEQMFGIAGVDLPSPGSIVTYTIVSSATLGALAVFVGAGSTIGGQLVLYFALAVAIVGMYFAFKIFMLQLELALIALLAPLSFSLLGLSALRDQGIAPLKALLSLTYRVILMTVILSAFSEVHEVVRASLSGLGTEAFLDGVKATVNTIFTAVAAYFFLAYLAFRSDSIAATLASGSTNLGPGDVAQAAAMGAAAGAAIASAGATLGGVAGNAKESMSEFLGRGGRETSIANAGLQGTGEAPKPSTLPSNGFNEVLSVGQREQMVGGERGSGTGNHQAVVHAAEDVASKSIGPALDVSADNRDLKAETGKTDGTATVENTGNGSNVGGASSAAPAASADALQPAPAPGGFGANDPAPGGPSSATLGSGSDAAISGTTGGFEKKLDALATQLSHQTLRKPSLTEKIASANQHMSREQGTTHVSVNSHHTD